MSDRLEDREGLPDALRTLLESYPRHGWVSHDNFGGLIRFWLDRHVMFRRLLEAMQAETEKALEDNIDPRLFGERLARYGRLFVGELHAHHSIEDQHYFPRIRPLEPSLDRGFDLLDRDHHSIDEHLNAFTEDAERLFTAIGKQDDWKKEGEEMRKCLLELTKYLDRHLTDEEELIVPVLLKHAPAELT